MGSEEKISICVRLFAIYRERAAVDHLLLTLPKQSTVAEVLSMVSQEYLGPTPLISHTLVAVNQEYAELKQTLMDGDEVALIPPVSGGSSVQSARDRLSC